jgi:hypothetical protein
VIATNGRLDQARAVSIAAAQERESPMARVTGKRCHGWRRLFLDAARNRLADKIAQLMLWDGRHIEIR